MASKQGYGADLKNYVDKRIQINLNGNRKLIGKLKGYDPFMNIVLENAIDITKNNIRKDIIKFVKNINKHLN